MIKREEIKKPLSSRVGKASTEAIQKEIDEIGTYGKGFKTVIKDGVKEWKIPVADNCIRNLPPLENGTFYGLKIFVHYNVGVNKEQFLCLAQNFDNETCPVCEHQKQIRNEGASDKEITALYPSKKYLFNIIDMNKKEEGVQLFNCPKTIAENMLSISKEEDTNEPIDISDAEAGYNFYFTRTGVGMIDTKYSGFRIARKPTMLENPDWLDEIKPLEDALVIPSPEEMEEAVGTGTPPPEVATPAKGTVEDTETFSRRGGRSSAIEIEDSPPGEDAMRAKLRKKLKERGLV